MRSIAWLSVVSFASAFSAVVFASGTASAAPCCSAPICQQDIPPPICALCSDCAAEDPSDAELVYDDTAGLCYVAE